MAIVEAAPAALTRWSHAARQGQYERAGEKALQSVAVQAYLQAMA